ncbi:hypothetical protein ABIB82_003447 [Bradyrhizobium sp. i1.8.4]
MLPMGPYRRNALRKKGRPTTIRSRREVVAFQHSFRIKDIDGQLPAGVYEIITNEEAIEGLSFAAFRRVATMITGDEDGGDRLGRSRRCPAYRRKRIPWRERQAAARSRPVGGARGIVAGDGRVGAPPAQSRCGEPRGSCPAHRAAVRSGALHALKEPLT